MEERIVELERSHHLYLQYGWRSSIEISGIPEEIKDEDLEDHVIKSFDEINLNVHGKSLKHKICDIQL